MIALLDGDLLAFRAAASAEQDSVEVAIARMDKQLNDILNEVGADSYRVFLSGQSNFRKEIDPDYKANRKDHVEPQFLQQCKEFLIVEHKAELEETLEADDLLGINQTEETIICSLDKDLLQVPGKHYQWEIGTAKWTKEAKFHDIEPLEGLRTFYGFSLIGDKSDNIIGVAGIGKVKAEKKLLFAENEQEMFDICRELYDDDERYFRNLKLLWVMREHGDIFDPVKKGLINA